MPDVVMIIAPEVFRDEEYAEPLKVLTERGARVVTASTHIGECIGKLGMKVQSEATLTEVSQQPWDAAVFIGGGGASVFFYDPDAHRLARETAARGGVVAAICIAPSTLAHAGLLDGVAATAFPSQREDIVAHGAIWIDAPAVTDGRIVTANGPEAAAEFGNRIADLLGL